MRQWEMWACDCDPGRDGSGRYRHIGPKRYVELHGLPYPIVKVRLTENPWGDYWGWLRSGTETPTMIWPNKTLFNICFPYGPEVSEQRGDGTILRFVLERME